MAELPKAKIDQAAKPADRLVLNAAAPSQRQHNERERKQSAKGHEASGGSSNLWLLKQLPPKKILIVPSGAF